MATSSPEQEPEDPITYFLDDQEHHGKSERTLEAYDRVLREYEAFLGRTFDGVTVPGAGRRECMAFIHAMREDFEDSTIATYASYLNRFYDYMAQVGVFDRNPMVVVMEELPESIDTNPTRRDISVPEMASFVAEITHPLDRAVVLTLVKTGIRAGELCNLDLRDCHVAPLGLDTEWSPRVQIEAHPNSLFVDASAVRGRTVNGEERHASNKRKRDTVLPVDDELRAALIAWLAIRPDPVSAAEPLFLHSGRAWGERLDPADIHYIVEKHASGHGWYSPGAGAADNVTPHYFRHFFTTHLRDRIGDRGVVKYMRGDVADDVIETYTHNWNDRVREIYLDHIYRLVA